MSPDRGHLSIGEVLSLLTAEFPDVTISKIRFLESQGLIDPERTPSGYRKFYEPDIARLRWILTQQRDHFLPLKVIKDRLAQAAIGREGPGGPMSIGGGRATAVAELDPTSPQPSAARGTEAEPTGGAGGPGGATAGTAGAAGQPEPGAGDRPGSGSDAADSASGPQELPLANGIGASAGPGGPGRSADPATPGAAPPAPSAVDVPDDVPPTGGPQPAGPGSRHSQTRRSTDAEAVGAADSTPPDAGVVAPVPTEPPWVSRARAATRAERAERPENAERFESAAAAGPGAGGEDTPDRGPGSASGPNQPGDLSSAHLTPEELLAACDLSAAQLAELERFGLVSCRELASGRFYDDDAVVVARLASRFAQFGIEARHLRMFKVAAEREAALYEQVVSPLAHHRDPARGTRASEVLGQLESLGEAMRVAMVRRAERDTFGNR